MKYTVGRPPAFESAEALDLAICDYFENPPTRTVLMGGKELLVPVLTITGLCLHIGFESRQSFYDYEKKPKFTYIVKRARMFIEHEYEGMLGMGNCAGAIFALKNHGWKDTIDMNQTISKPKTLAAFYGDTDGDGDTSGDS